MYKCMRECTHQLTDTGEENIMEESEIDAIGREMLRQALLRGRSATLTQGPFNVTQATLMQGPYLDVIDTIEQVDELLDFLRGWVKG